MKDVKKIRPSVIYSEKKLAGYSAAAAAFLLLSENVKAQEIYTDIVPDASITVPGTAFDLDLNNDDTVDYIIVATASSAFSFTYYGAANFFFINEVLALPQNSNSIAAKTGSYGYIYPYAISSDINIGPYGQFLHHSIETLAYHFYAILYSYFYQPIAGAGNWLGGRTDKFLGLKLKKDDSTYYGWARLDVGSNDRSFTIKDYAYEAKADSAIQTQIASTGVATVEKNSVRIYGDGNAVHISLPGNIQTPCNVAIYDVQGKQIFASQMTDRQQVFTPDAVASGIYFVSLTGNNITTGKKIFLAGK